MESPAFSVEIQAVGKRFYRRWLFRQLSFRLIPGSQLALVGHNGSGKSTLLRILAGQMSPSEGRIEYYQGNNRIPADSRYRHLAWSGPQVELYPELTLREQYRLQRRFRPFLLSESEFLQVLRLDQEADKPLRYYSSGMLQRAKVGLAVLSEADILLLDEPTSNLDADNASRMLALIQEYQGNRILVLASNLRREFGDIGRQIHLGERPSA